MRGIVRRWFAAKGFGFIGPDGGGADVFVHRDKVVDDFKELSEGGCVEFDLGRDGMDRPCAISVRRLSDDSAPAQEDPNG